ncbi:MAG: nitroreductase family protein [Sedimentisphaerales bacterium]|nr:nitroreductase family protein [Sedimentisphaerales bacterium]
MENNHIQALNFAVYPEEQMLKRSQDFYDLMKLRRSVRQFSNRPIPAEIIENCIKTAGTAPSGANMQPWHFYIISDQKTKKQIRIEAEQIEAEFYSKPANQKWVDDIKALGTNFSKPFLEDAPCLIAVFSKTYDISPDGTRIKHYYVKQSVGIAVGFLIAAIHNAHLACLTYTPASMDFLNKILNCPENERPFMLIPVGYPAENCQVPNIKRKTFRQITGFF